MEEGRAEIPVIEGFDALEAIGQGGFSTVYAATQLPFDRRVAIKVLEIGPSGSRRLLREAQALGGLSDIPHVVQAFQTASTSDGRPALVMALMRSSLRSMMERPIPPGTDLVIEWLVQIAGALDEAHRRGIHHRDIKPENVLISQSGEAFLADFGIAALDDLHTGTTTAMSLSPPYAPPERLTSEGSDPGPGDVYSLAATFFAVLTGAAPFGSAADGGVHGLMMRVVSDPLPTSERLHPSAHAAIARAMSKDPGARHRTASEFATELREAFERQRNQTTVISPSPLIAAPSGRGALPAPGQVRTVVKNRPTDPSPAELPEAVVAPPPNGGALRTVEPATAVQQDTALALDAILLGVLAVAVNAVILSLPDVAPPVGGRGWQLLEAGASGLVVAVLGWPGLGLWYSLEASAMVLVAAWLILEVLVPAIWSGTLGQLATRVRLVDSRGAKPPLWRILLRAVVRPFSALPVLAGYWLPRLRGLDQTWHDRMSGVFAVRSSSGGTAGSSDR